jgi:hypothetical protein
MGCLGLWIAHQLADDVFFSPDTGSGFTVRAGVTQR